MPIISTQPTVRISRSFIEGKGLFATRNIKKGESLFKVEGPIIRYAFEPNYRAGANWLQIRQNVWKMPLRDNVWNFINHSCQPNAGLQHQCVVVAMCDIKLGEEVLIDYSTVEASRTWHMNCRCAQKNCRKVIRSIKYLPRKTFLSYQQFVPYYLQQAYFKEKTYSSRDGRLKKL